MNSWGKRSKECYDTLNEKLQKVCDAVLKDWNCKIHWGFRTHEEQEKLFEEGATKAHFPDSLHNRYPSRAVDLTPYPVPEWEDIRTFDVFGGYVLGVAKTLGIGLRWGGDWDSDKDVHDQTFNDLMHFELKEGE